MYICIYKYNSFIHHVHNRLNIVSSVFLFVPCLFHCFRAFAFLMFWTCFKFRGPLTESSNTMSEQTFLGGVFVILSMIFFVVFSHVLTYSLLLPFLVFPCMLVVKVNTPMYSATAFPQQVISIPNDTFSIQVTLFLQSGFRFRNVQNRFIFITSSLSGCGSSGTHSFSLVVQYLSFFISITLNLPSTL